MGSAAPVLSQCIVPMESSPEPDNEHDKCKILISYSRKTPSMQYHIHPIPSHPIPCRLHVHQASIDLQHPSSTSSCNLNSLTPSIDPTRPPDSPRPSKRIFSKSPRQRLLAADFLTANEAVYRHRNSSINIRSVTVFRQSHLGERF